MAEDKPEMTADEHYRKAEQILHNGGSTASMTAALAHAVLSLRPAPETEGT